MHYYYRFCFRLFIFLFITFGFLISPQLFAQTDTLKISWNLNDTSEAVTHYELHRMVGTSLSDTTLGNYSFFIQVDSTNGSIVSNRITYIDRTRDQINPGRLISYRVLAVNDSGLSSPLSNEAHAGIPLISWPSLPDSVILNPYIENIIPYDTIFPGGIEFLRDPDHNDSQLILDTLVNFNSIVIADNNQNVLRISADPTNLVETASVILEARDPVGFYDRDTLEFFFSLNNPPQIINFNPIRLAKVDSLYQYQVEATDPDPGDVLTFSLTAAPPFLGITAQSDTTALISGTPTINDTGQYNISVRVEDLTGLFDTRNYNVTVTDTILFVNAPVIISTPEDSAYVNSLYQYQVVATDADPDDILVFSLPTAPSFLGIATQSDTSAIVSGTPLVSNVGQFDVRIIVTDLVGFADTQFYQITVTDTSTSPNFPPQITSQPDTLTYVDSLYQYQVVASDPNPGDILEYSLPISPTFMNINPNTGFISGTPQFSDSGRHTVRVVVTDQLGASALQNYQLRVRGPVIQPPLELAGDPIVFPNPFRPSQDHQFLVIEPVPTNAKAIMIISPSGDLVYEQTINPFQTRRFVWNVRNTDGLPVASGFYIYIFRDGGDSKVFSGKIAIIR
jgi:hypothetical protein